LGLGIGICGDAALLSNANARKATQTDSIRSNVRVRDGMGIMFLVLLHVGRVCIVNWEVNTSLYTISRMLRPQPPIAQACLEYLRRAYRFVFLRSDCDWGAMANWGEIWLKSFPGCFGGESVAFAKLIHFAVLDEVVWPTDADYWDIEAELADSFKDC
jgi:hypothetical protein